jgi:hypothetical protein
VLTGFRFSSPLLAAIFLVSDPSKSLARDAPLSMRRSQAPVSCGAGRRVSRFNFRRRRAFRSPFQAARLPDAFSASLGAFFDRPTTSLNLRARIYALDLIRCALNNMARLSSSSSRTRARHWQLDHGPQIRSSTNRTSCVRRQLGPGARTAAHTRTPSSQARRRLSHRSHLPAIPRHSPCTRQCPGTTLKEEGYIDWHTERRGGYIYTE